MAQNTSPRDKISRASWSLLSQARDTAETNLANAIKDGRIKLDDSQSRIFRELLKQSVEAGYHQAHRVFMREVDGAINQAEEAVYRPVSVESPKKNKA
jgi:hypothetical protein